MSTNDYKYSLIDADELGVDSPSVEPEEEEKEPVAEEEVAV